MVRPKRAASNAKKLKSTTDAESAAAPATSEETSTEPTHTNDTRSKEDDTAASPTVRKRRLASLNAEFLVHYCSTSNNHNNNNGNDASNHHSGNGHAQANNNSTGSGGANKRRRTISSRATTTNDDESTNKPKRRSPAGAKKVSKEADEDQKEEQVVVEPVKRKASVRGKRKSKKQEEESDEKTEDDEEETSEKEETGRGRGRRNGKNAASNQSKKVKEPAVVESLVSTRPRREAGLRASAMIIQTNEIEKSHRAFQFIHSTANTTQNGTEKKLKQSPKTEPVNKKHTAPTVNNNHTFQVPQAVSVFAASQQRQQQAAPDQDIKPVISNSNIMNHVNLLSKKKQLSATYASQNNQSSNNLSSANTFPLRQISTCTTMGSLSALAPTPGATVGNIDNDSSSNEVQIVAEKCGTPLNGIKSPIKQPALIKTDLTEANLAEHNRLNGTTSGTNGAGTFNSQTKDYISRWAAEHAKYLSMTEEPFKADYVPIESFGDKILNDPQYKHKQGHGNNHHAVVEKNVVASSMGKTNLTKLSGVVIGGGAVAAASGIIKQDPHMKLNEACSMLNSAEQQHKIKPNSTTTGSLKHTASFPNLTNFNKSPHVQLSSTNTMAQLNSLANAINVTLQKQQSPSKSKQSAVPKSTYPSYSDSFGAKIGPGSSNKMNEANVVTEANVNKIVAAAFAAAAVNAAAAAVAANATTSKPNSNVASHRFAPTSHAQQPTSNNHSSNSHLSLFQQHLNSHLALSNNLPDHHHNSIKSTISMPSLNPACNSNPAPNCSNNSRSTKQDIYHSHHHPQSFPLMSHAAPPTPLDSHKILNPYMSHHHHHTEFLKSMNPAHHHSSMHSSIPHHHHHIHDEAKIKSEKQTYLDHHHHHMPPPVINVENVNFYGTLPPSGSSKCDNSDELKLVAKFNLGKSGLCAKTSCDSCCNSNIKPRHQSLSPPSHRSCSGGNKPTVSTAASTAKTFNDSKLTAESMALNLAKLFNQAAAVASSRMDEDGKLKLETKSSSNVSSSLKVKSNKTAGGNESSMHAERDETDSVVSVSSSSSSVKQISVHSKSDLKSSTNKPLEIDQEDQTKAPSVRSSDSSVNLIVDESNNNNSVNNNPTSNYADDEETNLTKKSQIKESETNKESSDTQMDLDEQTKPAIKLISVDSCDNSSMQAFTALGETSSPSNIDKEATTSRSEGEKKEKNWKTTTAPIIETEEETTEYENGSSEPSKKTSNLTKYYASVKNHQTELEIKLNDFVMIESNIDLIKERRNTSPEPAKNESSDVLNETSHSNYSLSESEMAAKQDSQQTTAGRLHEYILQIKSIWADSLSASENLMISGKIFLRPSQLNEILSESESRRTFDQNELIEWIDFENRVEMFSVDCVKCKCEVTMDSSGGQSNLFCNYEYDFRQKVLRLVDKKGTS